MSSLSKIYDQISPEFSASRVLAWPELSVVIPYIQDGFKILDLGCGAGRLLTALASSAKKFDYTGIDFSEGLISEARRLFPERNFLLADMNHLDFAPQSFNLVCAVASFHHLPSPREREKLLKDVYRWLKPGGYFFMTNWNLWQKKYRRYYFKNFWRKKSWRDFYIPWQSASTEKFTLWRYYHSFGLNELAGLLKRAGFRVNQAEVYKTKWNIVSLVQK